MATDPRPVIKDRVEVSPGDRYTLKDENDEELLIDGVDDPALVQLAMAVDALFVSRSVSDSESAKAMLTLREKYDELPDRIKRQFAGWVGGSVLKGA